MTLDPEMYAEREEAQGSPPDRQLHREEVQEAQGGQVEPESLLLAGRHETGGAGAADAEDHQRAAAVVQGQAEQDHTGR